MELPGLTGGISPNGAAAGAEQTRVTLPAGQEYRFEVEVDKRVSITLAEGTAEVFGAELMLHRAYEFTGYKGVVFTWKGAVLTVAGEPSVGYIGEETVMTSHVNLHFALQQLRTHAFARDQLGPRVCVIGSPDSGKTSLVKTLAAYAARQGSHPLLVNLDPSEGSLVPPGTISAFPTPQLVEVGPAFASSETTGPMAVKPVAPVAYFYGFDAPLDAKQKYKTLVAQLGITCLSRLKEDKSISADGCVIDMPSLVDQHEGYDIIGHTIADFDVDVLVVIGSERLYSDMVRRYEKNKGIRVLRLRRSGGAVERNPAFRRSEMAASFHRYFYNVPQHPLSPYSTTVPARLITAYRTAEEVAEVHSSALPIGYEPTQKADGPRLEKLELESISILQNSILGVSQLDAAAPPEDVMRAPIMGFVFISDVNDTKNVLTVLSPLPAFQPTKALLVGTLKWQDD